MKPTQGQTNADWPVPTEAVTKSALPIVLVATKCDVPSAERKVEPSVVEQNAKRINKNIATLQVSELNPEGYKRGILMLMNAIVKLSPGMLDTHIRAPTFWC